jgi:hypothetical protein
LGSGVRALATGLGWKQSLSSPASTFVGLALAYALSLGASGAGLVVMLGLGALLSRRAVQPIAAGARSEWAVLALLAFVMFARPWVPTGWDEFIWLGKARFASQGFSAGVQAALDPAQHLIPAGYPPLWPLAVGWLSLGHDAVETHVLGASLLMLVCVAVALEAWREALSTSPRWAWALLLGAPLVLVHLRSTYVDLPVGLLGVALLGQLLSAEGAGLPAVSFALCLAAFKDEGLAQVLAATVGALVLTRKRALVVPAVAALVAVGTWRALVHFSGIPLFDHALGMPQWGELPHLVVLGVLHATDLFSWGVFWALAVALLFTRLPASSPRAVRVMLLCNGLFSTAALLMGPERVRVFAENGTLLNRLLVQLWPGAALLMLLALRPAPPISSRGA